MPARLLRVHMGARRRYDREGVDGDWAKPHEPIETEGCPGSWYRTAFVASVLRYARRGDGDGGRIPNRLLDLCDDELVIEAVDALETAEDAWRSEWISNRVRKAQEEAGHGR